MEELKEYHFTNEQIDRLLRLVRNKAFQMNGGSQIFPNDVGFDYDELANQIEDQIVNHPTNE